MLKKEARAIHYHIYVVLLDKRVAFLPGVLKNNPNRNSNKPCIYVGMTGLDPSKRFKKHKAGDKASRYVQKYGMYLMPELYKGLNPLTYNEAAIAEQGLARRLRSDGYTVVGGH